MTSPDILSEIRLLAEPDFFSISVEISHFINISDISYKIILIDRAPLL